MRCMWLYIQTCTFPVTSEILSPRHQNKGEDILRFAAPHTWELPFGEVVIHQPTTSDSLGEGTLTACTLIMEAHRGSFLVLIQWCRPKHLNTLFWFYMRMFSLKMTLPISLPFSHLPVHHTFKLHTSVVARLLAKGHAIIAVSKPHS